MMTLLLIIIYISFISLGLPDSLLGSAWPVMYGELQVPVSFAGIISMIIAGGTIISSFFSEKIIRRLGTGPVTAISVFMTAAALLGFSLSHSAWLLCILAVPYGLGAGSVDAALNNFVALDYKAHHMSWLHCFWGIGATAGPFIMSLCLNTGKSWHSGYMTIALIQIILTVFLFLSLPLWKKQQAGTASEENGAQNTSLSFSRVLQLPGAKPALLCFFGYCALEASAGLWGSSYFVLAKGIPAEKAAQWTSLFYFGITFGRFISGFLSMKVSDKNMVRLGQAVALIGILVLCLPFGPLSICGGYFLIGLGCAPIYPSLLHATPANFGREYSQAIMGIQMACAYVGSTFMPPLFGLIAQYVNIRLFPCFLLLFVILMVITAEKLKIKSEVS